MAKGNKPTMNQVKEVINRLIYEINTIQEGIVKLDGALSSYVDFNGNKKEWIEFVNKKIKKDKENESKSKKSGNSSGKNRSTETRKKASSKKSK